MELKATSDPVSGRIYVAAGPAMIEDGKLKISELPARATFPLRVKVVAYQSGRGIKPLVQTASPVEQTIPIEKQ